MERFKYSLGPDSLNTRGGDMPAGKYRVVIELNSLKLDSPNLETLHEGTAPDAILVGSVTRDGEAMRALQSADRVATRPRTLEAFRSLAEQAAWSVQHVIERPFSYNLRLVKHRRVAG